MKIRDLVLAAAVPLALGATAVAQDIGSADAAIKYRQDVMGAVGGNVRAMVAILNGEVDNADGLAAHAAALAASTDMALTEAAFRQNTDGQGSEETTATAEIWNDWDGFTEQLTLLQAATASIAASAAAGELTEFDQLRPALATCGACHRELGYRQR